MAAAAAAASAQDGLNISALSGFNVGGSVGQTHWKGGNVNDWSTDKQSSGGKIYGGYSFTPNVGLELGYVDVGKFKGPSGNLRGDGLYVDAVGLWPIGNDFSALGRVGVFNGKLEGNDVSGVETSDRGTNIKAGLGLQYDLSKSLGIRAEWERYRFDALNVRGNTDLYSVGINFKF